MAGAKFKKTGDWKRMAAALDPKKFGPVLEKHVGAAIAKAGHLLQGRARRLVRDGVPPPNAALTSLIKKSTKPLVDRSDLMGAIAVDQTAWNHAFVGVKRTEGIFNVALIVHDGKSIAVTDRMRRMFWNLWLAGQGRLDASALKGRAAELWARAPGAHWRPLKDSTVAIVIPPRPFLRMAFEHIGTKSLVGKTLAQAIRAAIAEQSKSGPGGPGK